MGIRPVGEGAHNNPTNPMVVGRYGLVDEPQNCASADGHCQAPANGTGARYGLVGVVSEGAPDNRERIIRTPRRRLSSVGVFEEMIVNMSLQTRSRSKSFSVRQRARTVVVPRNQMLISTFATPKREKENEEERVEDID